MPKCQDCFLCGNGRWKSRRKERRAARKVPHLCRGLTVLRAGTAALNLTANVVCKAKRAAHGTADNAT